VIGLSASGRRSRTTSAVDVKVPVPRAVPLPTSGARGQDHAAEKAGLAAPGSRCRPRLGGLVAMVIGVVPVMARRW